MKRLLIAALVILCALPAPAQSTGSGGSERDPKVALPCGIIIGVTVLATGGYIAYELWQFCKRKLPLTPPPPPPPPVITNAPPRVDTNSPPSTNHMARLNVNPDDVAAYAIEAYGYTAPDGTLYSTLITMNLATSADLSNWEAVPVKVYMSESSILTQVGTNGASIQPYTLNWEIDVGMNNPSLPMKFLRSATP
jgi:hypothetical protein